MVLGARPAAPRLALATLLLVAATACASDPAVAPSVATEGNGITRPPVPAPDLPGRGELVSSSAGPRVPRLVTGAVLLASGASRAFSARYDAQPYVVRYRTPGV